MRIKLIICIFLFFHTVVYSDVIDLNEFYQINSLLGAKYRKDGVTNRFGLYTLFEKQELFFKDPGFNCSGFVLTMSRILLNNSINIDEARKDLNENSSSGSEFGQDWDFGRDLIMNITSPYGFNIILPNSESSNSFDINAFKSLGFSLHDLENWKNIFPQIKNDKVYFVAFSRKAIASGYKYLYYHVAIIVKDSADAIWLYHATPGEGAHRIFMNSKQGMKKFQEEFKEKKGFPKKLLIIEVKK